MKILVDGMPRNLGGIGTLLINLVHCNERNGNKENIVFEFLIPVGSAYKELLEREKYKYYEVPRVLTRKYKSTVNAVFEENHYDFVWINNTSKVNIYLLKKAKKYRTLIIVHSHGVSNEVTGLKGVVYRLIECIIGSKYCKLIDIPLACSIASADYFYPKKIRKKCLIVSNGIEVEKYKFDIRKREKIRTSLNIQSSDILLGAVGRLTKVKNYVFLINLISELPLNYKLIIVGDGEDEQILNKHIDELSLKDRVMLLGKVSNVEDYLCAMDYFMMPSLNEGMPFSLIEAQANGLKCLVSTGISTETDLTGLVRFISINAKDMWKQVLINDECLNLNRESAVDGIIKSGFSIEHSYELIISCLKNQYQG